MASSREAAIDVLKACAIATVIYIHACGSWFHMDAVPVEAFLTWWAVPGFFFASGFLRYRDTPISAALFGKWMRRLLVPYAIATLLAVAVQTIGRGGPTLGAVLFAFVSGSGWGIYYYVPVLASALLLAVVLSRAPRLSEPCFAVFLVLGLLVDMGIEPITHRLGVFWLMRCPHTWWGYFLAGWVTARHRTLVHGASASTVRAVGAVAIFVWAAIVVVHRSFLPWDERLGATMSYVTNYCVIVAIVALARDARPGRLVRFLSENTYPLYLYHFFFTVAVRQRTATIGSAAGALALFCGFVGPLVILAVGRRLLGERARLLLG